MPTEGANVVFNRFQGPVRLFDSGAVNLAGPRIGSEACRRGWRTSFLMRLSAWVAAMAVACLAEPDTGVHKATVVARDTTAVVLITDSASTDSIVDTVFVRTTWRAREGWEYLLAVPGVLLTLPIQVVTRAVAGTAWLVQQTGIDRFVQRLLLAGDPYASLTPSFSLGRGFALSYRKYRLFGEASELRASGAYGFHNRHALGFGLANGGLFRTSWGGSLSFAYRYLPEENFYGIGPETDEDDETDFGLQDLRLVLTATYAPGQHVVPSLSVSIERFDRFDGSDDELPNTESVFTAEELPGLQGEPLFFGVDGGLTIRSASSEPRPASGLEIITLAGLRAGLNTDEFGYWFGTYEVRFTLLLPRIPHRAIILRHLGGSVEPFEDREIPFYLLNVLGGEGTVRGLPDDRFRDRDVFVFSGEYQYQIWAVKDYAVDFFVFADAGQVGDDIFFGLDFGDYESGYGFGIRLYQPGKLVMSSALGFSDEGPEFYLSFRVN